jgi:peptidoglycan/LPS O-acetylase OafA/YrhL
MDQATTGLTKPELKALTGVRGVTAIVVALAHFRIMLPANLHMLYMWHNAAVDLFFVLSGFTLCYAYPPRLRPGPALLGERFAGKANSERGSTTLAPSSLR